MNALDAKTLGRELGSLVIHEGDEWAHYERGAGAGDPRKLIAKGFSSTCGHNQKQVAPRSGGAAYSLLIGAKVSKSKGSLQESLQVGWSRR